ncbi:hypothetical protein SBA4_6290003 [Candidatus Sulfopaludibacter sp. SbA4]|nr:hypothetical protein SBA4_6290003 [Candidatus Sulfopaludibacter sp. SbA4]
MLIRGPRAGEPRLLLHEAGGCRWRRIGHPIAVSEKLADRQLGVGGFDFVTPYLVECLAGPPPSVHPLTQEFTVLSCLQIGHTNFKVSRFLLGARETTAPDQSK